MRWMAPWRANWGESRVGLGRFRLHLRPAGRDYLVRRLYILLCADRRRVDVRSGLCGHHRFVDGELYPFQGRIAAYVGQGGHYEPGRTVCADAGLLILNYPGVAVGILAVFTYVTVGQRMYHVWYQYYRESAHEE